MSKYIHIIDFMHQDQTNKVYRKGLPTSGRLRVMRTRRRPHVDNPREFEMNRQIKKIGSLKVIYVDLKVPLCY